MFEEEDNNQQIFKSVPAKRETDTSPLGKKESAPINRRGTFMRGNSE